MPLRSGSAPNLFTICTARKSQFETQSIKLFELDPPAQDPERLHAENGGGYVTTFLAVLSSSRIFGIIDSSIKLFFNTASIFLIVNFTGTR